MPGKPYGKAILCLQIISFLYITCSETALHVGSWLQQEIVQPTRVALGSLWKVALSRIFR